MKQSESESKAAQAEQCKLAPLASVRPYLPAPESAHTTDILPLLPCNYHLVTWLDIALRPPACAATAAFWIVPVYSEAWPD